MKKSLLIAAAAAGFMFAAPITAEAATQGWNQIDGSWFWVDEDGDYAYNEWVDNNQYYVNYDGIMVSDGCYSTVTEVRDADGDVDHVEYKYMVFDENGKAITTPGWAHVDDSWYWINEKGYAGLVNTDIDEDDYYYDLSKAGWVLDGGKWYYVDSDGLMRTGKISICTNPDKEDPNEEYKYDYYWLKKDGEMVTGWYNTDPASTYGDWVYCGADGKCYDGWLLNGGKWYYIYQGRMISDRLYTVGEAPEREDFDDYDDYEDALEKFYDNNTYYFDRNGVMVYGWYHNEYTDSLGHYSDSWYYTNPSTGVRVDGWVLDGGKWYYVSDGVMLRNTPYYDDANAPELGVKSPDYPKWDDYKNADGSHDYDAYEAAVKKYHEDDAVYEAAEAKYYDALKEYKNSHYYIFDKNGVMVTGWYSVSDDYGTTWYYADANGVARTGWLKDGNNWYYIQYGRMLTNQYTPDGYFVDANGVCK